MTNINFEDYFPTSDDTYPPVSHAHIYDSLTFKSNVTFAGTVTQSGGGTNLSYSPATLVVAVQGSGARADYYTDGTNDEVQINAAIVAASAVRGKVFIKAGTYTINAAIVPLSNVMIQGEGNATILAGSGSQFSIMQNLATSGSPTTDIEICDLKIDGTNVSFTSLSPAIKGIYLQYSKRLKIHGVYVYNTWATGIGTDFLVDTQIDRCITESCGVRGVAAGMGTGCNGIGIGTGAYAIEDWIVSNCIAVNCGNNGLMLEDQFQTTRSAGNMFANCLAVGNKFGYRNSGSSYCTFANCWALNSTNEGFYVTTGDIGNIATAFNPQSIKFTDCVAKGNGTAGSNDGFLVTDGRPDGTLFDIEFSNCTALGNTLAGFEIKNINKVTLDDCKAYTNSSHGALIYSTSSAAPANKITVNGGKYYNNSQSNAGLSDGIRIGTSGSGTMDSSSVADVICFDDQGTKTQRYGVSIAGTNSTNVTINSCLLLNNRNAAFNTGANTGISIRNCLGWNPIGQATITVTASPFTYTAGNSPEDVFINGGTVSSIVKGSTTLASASPSVVHLEPNQAVVVTYSSAPTMATDKY